MNNKSIFPHNTTAKFSGKKIFMSVNLILISLVTGCSTSNPLVNQPTDFCEYVDPTSKYYNPDVLTLEQLSVCRTQAEKILAIQTMKIQIHQQREQSINHFSSVRPNGKEINIALNQLSTNEPQQTVTNSTQSRQRSVRAQQSNLNSGTSHNSTTPSHQIIVQKTHPNLGEQSIQQHYLKQRNSRATQQKLDQEQAQRIAGEVTTLLGDPTTKEKLSAPRLLSPGEETRNQGSTAAVTINKSPESSSHSQTSTIQKSPVNNPQTTQGKTNTVDNASTNNKSATGTPATNSSKVEDSKSPSADYTSSPTNTAPSSTEANSNSNTPTTETKSAPNPPIAEVVKPNAEGSKEADTLAPVNPSSLTSPLNEQNKNIGSYQAQPLPTLNEQDPLQLLQQRRAQNKQQ